MAAVTAETDEALEKARKAKAVKMDDAKVPVHLWQRFLLNRVFFKREDQGGRLVTEVGVLKEHLTDKLDVYDRKDPQLVTFGEWMGVEENPKLEGQLDGFRKLGLMCWKRNVFQSHWAHRQTVTGIVKLKGNDCVWWVPEKKAYA